jgi:hypothetical protein
MDAEAPFFCHADRSKNQRKLMMGLERHLLTHGIAALQGGEEMPPLRRALR